MDKTSHIRRLVMVGACYVDTILSVPHFPQEDHKLRANSLERRRGGNVANSLEVLQQLLTREQHETIELVLLCVLPRKSSPGTKFVENSLGPKVDMSHCLHRETHEEPASSYIIKDKDSGSRTIVNYNELPEMTASEFKQRIVAMGDVKYTWFHFEGREVETSVACMQWLRQQNPDVMLSVEVEKPAREGLDKMASEADIVFFSKTWAEAQRFSSAINMLEAQAKTLPQASLLCCTWGAEGSAVCIPECGLLHHDRPTLEAGRQVVDTVGAGDTFVAGIIYGMLSSNRGTDVQTRTKDALSYANQLATRKVLQEGFANLVA